MHLLKTAEKRNANVRMRVILILFTRTLVLRDIIIALTCVNKSRLRTHFISELSKNEMYCFYYKILQENFTAAQTHKVFN